MRTARAFNYDSIYQGPQSCDPLNIRAMRSSVGTCFELPRQVAEKVSETQEFCFGRLIVNQHVVGDLKNPRIPVFYCEAGAPPPESYDIPIQSLLVVGHETRAIPQHIRKVGQPLGIPVNKHSQS